MENIGFFHNESTSLELAGIEEKIKWIIRDGNACIILNLDNQLVVGYNEIALLLKPDHDFSFPPSLTYGTWKEYKNDFHASVFKISKTESEDEKKSVLEALKYAISLANGPAENFTEVEGYYITGFKAYDHWIDAINEGHGNDHGNWWNGTVWSECRTMAANFLLEIPEKIDSTLMEICGYVSGLYKSISKSLSIVSKSDLEIEKKVEILKNAKEIEIKAIDGLKMLIQKMTD
jgi:hypothetical protein